MSYPRVFVHEKFGSIRVVSNSKGNWVVGVDVAEILGYLYPSKAVASKVESKNKSFEMLEVIGRRNGNLIKSRVKTALINEYGVADLVSYSRVSTARDFFDWIVEEVFPSISVEEISPVGQKTKSIHDLKNSIKFKQEQIKKLEEDLSILKQQFMEMNAIRSYYDVVLEHKDPVSTAIIAADYGHRTTDSMNRLLAKQDVQKKKGTAWLLNPLYADMGYTQTMVNKKKTAGGYEQTIVDTHWTQKGRLFIYEKLKNVGILPIVERNKKEVEEWPID